MRISTKTDGRQVMSFDTKETAAFVRAALREAFPGCRFSVRMSIYSMGSSVYVGWTDGPTDPEVRRVTDRFTSRSFDGLDDSTHYHTQTVDGREVQYQGSISTSRHHSPELRALADRRAALLGIDNAFIVLRTLRPNGCRVLLKPEPISLSPSTAGDPRR